MVKYFLQKVFNFYIKINVSTQKPPSGHRNLSIYFKTFSKPIPKKNRLLHASDPFLHQIFTRKARREKKQYKILIPFLFSQANNEAKSPKPAAHEGC
jgi:hypothetical protein